MPRLRRLLPLLLLGSFLALAAHLPAQPTRTGKGDAAEEFVDFCERECGLRRIKVISLAPADTGNNQFVFEKPES